MKLVVDSGRTGLSVRVITKGSMRAGDAVTLVQREPRGVTIAFAHEILHHDRTNRARVERVLSVLALPTSCQKSFCELLKNCSN